MSKFYMGMDEEKVVKNESVEETRGIEKIVTTDVNVRVAPGGNVIGARHAHDKVVVIAENGGWSELKEGGFILSSLLS